MAHAEMQSALWRQMGGDEGDGGAQEAYPLVLSTASAAPAAMPQPAPVQLAALQQLAAAQLAVATAQQGAGAASLLPQVGLAGLNLPVVGLSGLGYGTGAAARGGGYAEGGCG